nr:YceI family protein [Bacteroidota bacterium]
MKKISILLVATVVALSSFKAVEMWKMDKAHSALTFTVTHMGISDAVGTFKNVDVTIKSEKADFSDAIFEFTAEAASVNTGNEMRDKHLISPEFFDVEKFPKVSFVSTGIKNVSKNTYKLSGNLTLHGVTKPVVLDMLYRGTIENPMSKATTSGFQVTGSIKRSDFAFGSGMPEALLSDVVTIKADGEFTK